MSPAPPKSAKIPRQFKCSPKIPPECGAQNLPQHQGTHETPQRRLSNLIGKRVADVAERERDDGRGDNAGQQANA